MDMEAAIANQVDFSLHLSHHVASKLAPSSNLVLSPLSLHVVLALLAAGSKGQTLDQLTSFLRSGTAADLSSLASQLASLVLTDASPSGGPVLAFPNAVWVDSSLSLKPSFRDVATSAFRAHAASLDFQNKNVRVEPCNLNISAWKNIDSCTTEQLRIWLDKIVGFLVEEHLFMEHEKTCLKCQVFEPAEEIVVLKAKINDYQDEKA